VKASEDTIGINDSTFKGNQIIEICMHWIVELYVSTGSLKMSCSDQTLSFDVRLSGYHQIILPCNAWYQYGEKRHTRLPEKNTYTLPTRAG
jgi:hypothetical protein